LALGWRFSVTVKNRSGGECIPTRVTWAPATFGCTSVLESAPTCNASWCAGPMVSRKAGTTFTPTQVSSFGKALVRCD